ncbi:serine acetyltransferase [Myroides odoratimimus]|uniref:serine O-acetyltransferase n=1 Tax=Myroides odoratimimus TaxID=76832 RepID=UPI002576CF76|nr:serine O-acetyltransferase [Myroides odoratimimus]MDM1398330.1 serine acetyltransferase [Myroides odoratimimus]MDM1496514.1 serine acetyltransferase [Myroides odoratimimus]MDM1529509.1 serine acetyltransferase [Myroides odoratimimus]
MQNDFVREILTQNESSQSFLDKQRIEKFTDTLFHFLFQLEDKKYLSEEAINIRLSTLKLELLSIVFKINNDVDKSQKIANDFFDALPHIFFTLKTDAQAILENDPAATCLQEVYIAYPGFYAIAIYRFAHQLHTQKVVLLPRIWTEHAHSKTGIDIHPAATIGSHFCIDHGTGIVIGETCVIGQNVKIYQGVTLGAISVSKDKANTRRHPYIEDNVIIYSGATILGGDTVIGHDTVIGGNVWLTKSVKPNSIMYSKSKSYSKDQENYPEPINFII